jgi:hypothetical protein
MTDERESAKAGSSGDEGGSGNGETIDLSQYVPKTQYEEAEKLIGTQGKELGELRDYFNTADPFLEKITAIPGLVDAIRDDKLDASLVQAILEGKVGVKEAADVQKATDAVAGDVGKDAFNSMKPEEIQKLVEEKLNETVSKLSETISKDVASIKERQDLESALREAAAFVEKTPDFDTYAEEVAKYMDEHPNSSEGVEDVYYRIKGKALTQKAIEDQKKAETESLKDSRTAEVPEDKFVEGYFGTSSNSRWR